ncbi:hypothetical protein [Pleionea sp. CnH1-48]|uniref:hypothetical protein n=1 Tax=Pleionea sp. CnH1-48 TaxID=2954494 RepID=UPI0020980F71|nr:hypothetical protein [Pleionea sp. CnH1-48]MCO7227530.1 hypothetical protein [Pleionea sp. CnH1-48]
MGLFQKNSLLHWNYFLAMEDDLEKVARYIEISKRNRNVYSLELARMLMASSAEVDVLLKSLCARFDSGAKADNINKYYPIVSQSIPNVLQFPVSLPKWGMSLSPLSSWKEGCPPKWWTANNKVKHHRHEAKNYEKANLKNVLNSIAALYILNLYFYKEQAESGGLTPVQKLFYSDYILTSEPSEIGSGKGCVYIL